MTDEVRLGGPCGKCGLAQIDRADKCAQPRSECPYGKTGNTSTGMRLAAMLRIYIAASNLQQKAICKQIGVNESTFSRFISGNREPDAEGFAKILTWCLGKEQP